jgi:TRAP-type uncharacterized transport system substrate-binding protein
MSGVQKSCNQKQVYEVVKQRYRNQVKLAGFKKHATTVAKKMIKYGK